jgi:serine palmitoyltransferase
MSKEEYVPFFPAMLCYIQYAVVISFGHLRDYLGRIFGSRYEQSSQKKGLAKLLIAWENFYTNRIYHRVQDVFNRPVAGTPGL